MLAAWAADCAERTLPLFEAVARTTPGRATRSRVSGRSPAVNYGVGPARALSVAAHAAARDVEDPAAVAAARAAGQAVATAHMGAHARGVVYAAIAAGLAAPDDPDAVATEARWQLEHATPPVREVLRRLPAPPRATRSVLARLIADLHADVTRDGTALATQQLVDRGEVVGEDRCSPMNTADLARVGEDPGSGRPRPRSRSGP